MLLTLVSHPDPASVNIRDRLLESEAWEAVGEFRGHPVRRHASLPLLMAETEETHIYAEGIDAALRDEAGLDFDCIVVASRHKAASGIPSLTVHPIGNPGAEAKYGGEARTYVPAPARRMTYALRRLAEEAKARGLRHDVGFEVTHHGPKLDTPTMFLEIGSKEGDWDDGEAGRACAAVIRSLAEAEAQGGPPVGGPALLGIGGGHYAPRHSDLARKRRCHVGHMVPNYILKEGADPASLARAAAAVPGCEGYHVDDKGGVPNLKDVEAALQGLGLTRVAAGELEPV